MAYVLNSTGHSRRRHRHGHCSCKDHCTCKDSIVFAQRSDVFDVPCRRDCQQPRPPRNVIYGGPCPPDPEKACQPPLPPPPCDPPWYRHEPSERAGFAYYAQTEKICVEACDSIPLNSIVREARGSFEKDGNLIRICRPGTYLAWFSLQIPECDCVKTQLVLKLDCEVIPGSLISVVKAPGAPGTAVIQVLFDVHHAGAELEIITSAPLELCGCEDDTLASLTIIQTDGMFNHRKHDHMDNFDRDCRNKQHRRCNCH